jgi:GNAT superfamily N-acetyltransferase
MAVAQVHVRSWQVAYRGLLPDGYLDQLLPEDRARAYDFSGADPLKPRTIVALEGGLIRGFATTAPSRDPDLANYGELCALYVAPESWGHGLGRALLLAARAFLFERGCKDALLWVLVGNERAQYFYEQDGWAADGMKRRDVVWGATVDELRYRRALDNLR